MTKHIASDTPPDPRLRALLEYVQRELMALLKEGFGELWVSCSVEKDQRRALTVLSGPTRRFVVPIDELPGAKDGRDP